MGKIIELNPKSEIEKRNKMGDLTPRETVAELDKYIIGQNNAKRSVAIALRNRWRRQQLGEDLKEEVAPKNIIMIGSTGVGKTEIARRLAKLTRSPFIKVEASKFTEIGYVGRDVESMVRDLTEITKNLVWKEKADVVRELARKSAEEKILDLLLPPPPVLKKNGANLIEKEEDQTRLRYYETREKFRKYLKEEKLDDRSVEIEVQAKVMPMIEVISGSGLEDMDINVKDMLGNIMPKKQKRKKMKVPDALEVLIEEEAEKLIDMDKVIQEAKERVEQTGIIFIDEIDKICGQDSAHGPDVSREGVQRDLLPIVEGSSVSTKYGVINTDHILFIAAGAFHSSKPSDLIPEMQGRFPIRVNLDSLGKKEFIRILKEPQNALIKQYIALMGTEGINLSFTDEAIEEIASFSEIVNEKTENIGARRLHTILEKLMDEISFDAPDLKDKDKDKNITKEYVKEKLLGIVEDEDLSRYIL